MSSEALPISPERFAEAIKDLSLATLQLKVLEISNSIAHLRYSNEQLRPFAEGREPVLGASDAAAGSPDQDCVDAMAENEVVMARMRERIGLVRREVESRGASWAEFESEEERVARRTAPAAAAGAAGADAAAGDGAHESTAPAAVVNGAASSAGMSDTMAEALRTGVLQMGVIRNGELHMDQPPPRAQAGGGGGGGSLTDEQLRAALEARMRMTEDEDDDGSGGLHL